MKRALKNFIIPIDQEKNVVEDSVCARVMGHSRKPHPEKGEGVGEISLGEQSTNK
jgi:hypothetical protein